MPFIPSIPLWGWFDILFNIVVLVALCGESHWALKWLIPNNSVGKTSAKWRREKLKKKFEFLLILGIAGEVGCLPFSLWESSKFNKEAGDARIFAGIAETNAAASNEQAKIAESNTASVLLTVEELRSNNIALEQKLQPRNITQEQHDAFVSFLKPFPQKPVWIANAEPTAETTALTFQIRKMLDDAGYSVKDSDSIPGETPFNGIAGGSGNGMFSAFSLRVPNPSNATVLILIGSSNAPVNLPEYGVNLYRAFDEAKIKCDCVNFGKAIKEGSVVIFVSSKDGF